VEEEERNDFSSYNPRTFFVVVSLSLAFFLVTRVHSRVQPLKSIIYKGISSEPTPLVHSPPRVPGRRGVERHQTALSLSVATFLGLYDFHVN
jgi:hypothetical protein